MRISKRYRIQEQLGRGGMAEVFLGWDAALERRCVLKVARGAQGGFLRREARVLAGLDHPAIPAVYDVGTATSGAEFLVMKWVRGVTLAERLHGGALDELEALRVARELTDALVHVHGAGFIHCDLKPSNLMLTPRGRVVLVDFGIADSPSEAVTRLARSGGLMGTPRYVAPECLDGSELSARTDLFGVGQCLYAALAGRPVVEARSLGEIIQAVRRGSRVPLRERRPQVTQRTEHVVRRCLALDPAARFGSARELADALDAAITALHPRESGFRTLRDHAFRAPLEVDGAA